MITPLDLDDLEERIETALATLQHSRGQARRHEQARLQDLFSRRNKLLASARGNGPRESNGSDVRSLSARSQGGPTPTLATGGA